MSAYYILARANATEVEQAVGKAVTPASTQSEIDALGVGTRSKARLHRRAHVLGMWRRFARA